MFKKVINIALVLCMCLSFASTAMAFDSKNERSRDIGDGLSISDNTKLNITLAQRIEVDAELDDVDVVLAAIRYLTSVDIVLDFSDIEVVPLLDLNGTKVAYYVSFSSVAYAVINNYRGNPVAIEFGEGENEMLRDLLASSSSQNIVYCNPISMWNYSDVSENRNTMSEIPSLYDTYPDLEEMNVVNATLHNEVREDYEIMLSEMGIRGDGDYGFVTLPSGTVSSSKTITSASSVTWAVMSSFNDIAKNHCGATVVTNLALYYYQRGYTNLRITNVRGTFEAVHKIIGNGPVTVIAGDAVKYFSNRGYTLNHSSANTQLAVKTALNNNRPLATLLADGLLNWHWVLTVGYREYTSGDFYMQIVTGWRNGIDRYYKPGTGSAWWSSTQYWVS